VKPDSLLVKEKVLPSQAEHRQARFLGLPGVIAPFFPNLIGKVVIRGPSASNNKLVEIGDKTAVEQGIISGKFVEGPDLMTRQLLFAVFPVIFRGKGDQMTVKLKPV
jgi:hypothetical protein